MVKLPNGMKGQKKNPKAPGFMRSVLAANLAALLTKHYADLPNITARQKKAASESGIAFSSVQRIMKGETGATLDNLESLAKPFGLSAYQMLIPSLDVNNPQIVKGASKAEQQLYGKYRRDRASERQLEKA